MRKSVMLLLAALVPTLASARSDPPRRLFISPMGEPFRTDDGAPEKEWFKAADRDGDGKITLTEFQHDAARFFAILDLDHNGSISPEEIHNYETVIAPEIQTRDFEGGGPAGGGPPRGGMGGGRMGGGGMGGGGMGSGGMGGGGMGGGGMGGGGMGGGGMGGGRHGGGIGPGGGGGGMGEPLRGAGRYGYFDTPEPVTATDIEMSGTITRTEFLAAAQRRFELLDGDQQGSLTERGLPRLKGNPDHQRRKRAGDYQPAPTTSGDQ